MKDLLKVKIIDILLNRIEKEIEYLAPHMLRVILDKLISIVRSFENKISKYNEINSFKLED